MVVVVTGAAGLIGRHAVSSLVDAGHRVRALDRERSESWESSPSVEVVVGNCMDPAFMAEVLEGAEAVVHLASLPSPRAGSAAVFVNNAAACFVALDAAAVAGVRCAVVASSTSILGLVWGPEEAHPFYVPIDDAHPLQVADAYALSKQADEATAWMLHRRSGLSTVLVRFPWVDTSLMLAQRGAAIRADPALGASELWTYLDVRDAAEVLRAAIDCSNEGVSVVYAMAPETLVDRPTADLLQEYHPQTVLTRPLSGREAPYDLSRMRNLLHFSPQHIQDVREGGA